MVTSQSSELGWEVTVELPEDFLSLGTGSCQGSTKMYHTVREHYWWRGMKKDVAEFSSRCLICQQVKAEHQRPAV